MTDCKVMLKSSLDKVRARFQDYADLEFSNRGDWILVEDFSGTQLFGWEVSSWIELAAGDELIYAYYDENMNGIRFCGPAYRAAVHHSSAGSPVCRRRSHCRCARSAESR